MIDLCSDYIKKYIVLPKILPGEHHFVSVYLAPKIYKITGMIPDYINPDGTKNIQGDIIYSGKNIFIEVKFIKLLFTKKQYNKWIFNEEKDRPNYIICINQKGILIQEWETFRENYKFILNNMMGISLISLQNKKYTPIVLLDKYIETYKNKLKTNEYFNVINDNEDKINERIYDIFNRKGKNGA